jgi:hypothetical protein
VIVTFRSPDFPKVLAEMAAVPAVGDTVADPRSHVDHRRTHWKVARVVHYPTSSANGFPVVLVVLDRRHDGDPAP